MGILPTNAPGLISVSIAESVGSHNFKASETSQVVWQKELRLLVVRGKLIGGNKVISLIIVL